MPGLNEETINKLIVCEKKIFEAPKRNMTSKNRSLRNDMKLISTDLLYNFSVFMRISEDFPEDFSIGLVFISAEGKTYMLFRCNGPHGECVYDFLENEAHYGYHEHKLVPDASSMVASITTAYGTYQDAVVHFVEKCNIIGLEPYFPFLNSQERLQFDLGL